MSEASPDSDRLAFALELNRLAEAEILPRFRNVAVEKKHDGTVVTEADREAERVMRARIQQRFPDDAILGEEWGASGSEHARRRWILDPIDGTIWFTLGVPLFGTLIGLVEEGRPVLGVVGFPGLGETLYAEEVAAASCRSAAARPSGCVWPLPPPCRRRAFRPAGRTARTSSRPRGAR